MKTEKERIEEIGLLVSGGGRLDPKEKSVVCYLAKLSHDADNHEAAILTLSKDLGIQKKINDKIFSILTTIGLRLEIE